MNEIKIKTLTLRNWRGEKERTTTFNVGSPTYICGDNGLGKSRHFDAFCWLLFGKDSQDRKDFEVRSYDEHHQPLHKCECSVEATLIVNGDELTLKRNFKEQWVKPKGQLEEVFKNNITECFWDGVPVKVTDYQKRVTDELIDPVLFKMITNPRYFCEKLDWKKMREFLFNIAGTMSDEEIAATSPEFQALLDSIKGKSLADFRKQLAKEKAGYKEEMDGIPFRIDQTQKMMPEAEDWASLEKQRDNLNKQQFDIQNQIENGDMRSADLIEKRSFITKEINAAKDKIAALVEARKEQLRKEADTKNEARRTLEQESKEAHEKLSQLSIDAGRNKTRQEYLVREIDSINKQLEQLRKEWFEINGNEYDGSDICPHCGQKLPADKIAEAHRIFDEHKQSLIRMNNERGQSLSEQAKSYKAELEQKKTELANIETDTKAAQHNVETISAKLNATPKVTVPEITSLDVPKCADYEADVHKLIGELKGLDENKTDDEVIENLKQQRTSVQKQLDDINIRLQNKFAIGNAQDEIDKLNKRGKELAQAIADIEKKEFTAQQFTKKKIEDCEQRINSMFSNVRFQLFDYTQEGNEYECCVPLVNGVPYSVANTASQLNAGLDIIDTLTRFYNISAPIFVDNAESTNAYREVSSQVIFLQVTKDKSLVIK
jgi:DNA repair exonuclease SbcCD ATPase subunit